MLFISIGSFFFSTAIAGNVSTIEAAEVSARQTIPVQYHYVVESELTEAEKNAVVKELPKFVEENSDAYYLVYRPKIKGLLENNLPRTGYSSLWEATFAVAGLTLAVLVIARGRNGKRYLSSILLVTGLGSILLAPSVFAVTNIELAAYNQRLNLTVGDKLPEPLEITGFEYVGYLKSEGQDKVNGERNYQIPTTQKGLSSVEVNKQAGKSVSFSENPSTPNKPVSTETEKLTEQEKAVSVKERESDRRFPVTELPELQLKSQDSTQTQVLPYQTEYQYSNELAEGQSQIIRKGISGTRTVITRNYIAGKEIVKSEVVSDQVTATPISEIILVGTATVKSVPKEAPVQEVPELTNYGTTPETAPIQEVPELTNYGTTPETAPVQEVPELTNYGTTPETAPVHEVPELTEYGTSPETAPIHGNSKLELTTNDEVRIEKIDFSIEEQYTDDIPEGSRQIATPGVQGERTIKTRVYSSNGQEIDRQELSNEETLAPVTQVVKVGTAKPSMVPSEAPKADALPEYSLTYTDETRVEKINFTIREEETDELVRDARQIATPGVQGERTIKTRVYSSNGQVVDRQELSNEETLAPVTQIVKVGTAKPTMVPNDAPKADALEEFDLISLHNLLAEADQIKAQARYFNDSQSHQSNYDTALMAGQAILSQSQASQAEVNQLVEQINQAKAQLSGLEVVKTDLQNEYDLNPSIKTTAKYKNTDSEKQTAYTDELAKAEGVLNNQTATQVQVNQALASLTAAKEGLNGVPKVKPTVSILSLTENPDDKSVTVQYRLEDQTQSFRSATAELYQGDQLVRTLPITNFAGSLKIGDLDYYTGYTLKTKLTYELDNGSFTDLETDSRNFELEYKKIAFRDIDSAEFYRKENDQFKRVVSMSSMPTDLSTYFVKVKSSESKEMLLPVHSIAESHKDGRDVYKVTVSLPELVQEGETGYKSSISVRQLFLVSKMSTLALPA